MKRIIACLVVLVSVLVAPRTTAQMSPQPQPYWSPQDARPGESVGEVVLKFTTPDTGRWEYYTKDGDCPEYPSEEDPANETPLSPAECGRPFARAGQDYGAVRGEWIFTSPGSRTITIPIINDDLDETDGEAFSINAFYRDSALGHLVNAYIRIGDDDPRYDGGVSHDADALPPAVTTTVVRAEQRPTGSPAIASAPPPGLEVALPSAELKPGVGFELVSGGDLEPPPDVGASQHRGGDRDRRRGGSAASWFALGLGATAAGSGGVVWLRRLRRWSPTRS